MTVVHESIALALSILSGKVARSCEEQEEDRERREEEAYITGG